MKNVDYFARSANGSRRCTGVERQADCRGVDDGGHPPSQFLQLVGRAKGRFVERHLQTLRIQGKDPSMSW